MTYLRLFFSLTEGDVVLLIKYKVRPRYMEMSKPTVRHDNLPRFDIEISLNKFGQTRILTVVPPDQVDAGWGLPAPLLLFITRDRLG